MIYSSHRTYSDSTILSEHWTWSADFDLVLCLEVAEHLSEHASRLLVRSLTRHGDFIVFSAAIPNQPGENHIHCRWPDYWQSLFNDEGYRCEDWLRWALWDDDDIEPWYRQNVFTAVRDSGGASREKRIQRVIHPEIAPLLVRPMPHPGPLHYFKVRVPAPLRKGIRRALSSLTGRQG